MHRLAYSAGRVLQQKPAAVVTSARRAGTTTALEAMEKVAQICQMPLVSSTYWPMVHGGTAEQAALDEEGMQIMRNLGHNMAWLLRCIEGRPRRGHHPAPGRERGAHQLHPVSPARRGRGRRTPPSGKGAPG